MPRYIEYARSVFHRVLNKPPILNMPGIRNQESGICGTRALR